MGMSSKKYQIPAIRFEGFTDTWEQREFEDVIISIQTGTNLLGSESNHGTALIKMGNVQRGFFSFKKVEFLNENEQVEEKNMANFGDFLFNTRNTLELVGKGATWFGKNDEYAFNSNIARFTFEGINTTFFNYLYNTPQMIKQVQARAVGTTSVAAVYPKDLNSIKFWIPSANEQQKIGALFKQIDDTITLHQRKLEKTKALKSAYLSELFPVEGERKPKRRFAGFIDDWKQGTVGEYGYFYYGKSAPKWSVTKDAIIPCVRYGELYTKFGAKIDKVYSYTNISKENLKFSTGNEVLVPRVGEDPLDFANCSWLSIPNVAIGEMISVYNTEENPLFISYYFNSQLRHAFAKRVEGGNVSNLYFTYLENITISIPNKEEQDTIANFLESLDSVVEHHQHKLEKLKNIKQAYLNELFV